MLSSITPLGQRARGSSWRRVVVGFWIGSLLGGLVSFGLVGAIGELTGIAAAPPLALVAVLGTGAILDLARVRAPGPSRQVDEDWLARYRGWVTGVGFGAQLGAGLTTIVTSYAVWALFVVAVLTGFPHAIFLGLAFAAGRALPLLSTRTVQQPAGLASLMARLADLERFATPVLLVGYLLAIGGLVSLV